MCWSIDPDEKTVFVYQAKREIEVFENPESLLPVPDFIGDLNLKVKDLFDRLFL